MPKIILNIPNSFSLAAILSFIYKAICYSKVIYMIILFEFVNIYVIYSTKTQKIDLFI